MQCPILSVKMGTLLRINNLVTLIIFSCGFTFIDSTLNIASTPYYKGPWRMVLKSPSGVTSGSHTSIHDFYTKSGSLNDNSVSVMSDLSASSALYKSSILDEIGTTRHISAVRLSAFKNGVERAYFIFNAYGKTTATWMSCTELVESSYTDVISGSPDICTQSSSGRNFHINKASGACGSQTGWFALIDYSISSSCSWDSATGAPYVVYSPSTTYTTWESSKEVGDVMVIFVAEWHLAFKGVKNLMPTEGSLYTLYTGTGSSFETTAAAKTLLASSTHTFKSGIINGWNSFCIIEMAKYVYFTGGEEKAFFLFDGKGTTNTDYFTDAKIIGASYTDGHNSKDPCNIAGDNIRRFQIWDDTQSYCDYNIAWMMVLDDNEGSAICAFDTASTPRPFFLYSASTGSFSPSSSGAWDSTNFPSADVMGIFTKGFYPIFKVAKGQAMDTASTMYQLWTQTSTLKDFQADSYSLVAGSQSYKSAIVDAWTSYYISAVRISFYTSGVEQAYIVLDAHGSTKTNWMAITRILYSSWTDLTRTATHNFFSIDGDSGNYRYFFAEKNYGGCNNDAGWFAEPVRASGCDWENTATKPSAMYSTRSDSDTNDNMVEADVFVISVAMENICAASPPCANGATCVDQGVRFVCSCDGTYYGVLCEDRDGVWTDWGSWGSCSVTCTTGTQTRTRTCTNPSKVGAGVDCVGDASESQSCTDVAICPVDGVWTDWTNWAGCTVTCDYGIWNRTRTCTNPAPAGTGADCAGDAMDSTSCYPVICPVDGGWTEWNDWNGCTVTCDYGTWTRSRTCTNPAPVGTGANCGGDSSESTQCYPVICPVDGGWTDWTLWADCTVTCEYGIWNRTRTCTNPVPVGAGLNCTGDIMESTSCYPVICPVDGMWGDWSAWGACSVTCETGLEVRTRNCDNPAKVGAGLDCIGDGSESQSCFVSDVCPVYNTGTLNENSQLDISCPGNLSYYVYIAAGYYGNPQYGSSTVCQASGATTTFTSACHGNTECSVTMNDATFGGDPCAYTTTTYSKSYYTQQFSKQCSQYSYTLLKTTYYQCYESRTLSRQDSQVNHHTRTKYGHLQYHCARDGVWSEWSTWTWCTVTCDSGTKDRNRTCNNPEMYAPGSDCPGDADERTDCYTQACPVCGNHWSAYDNPADCTAENDTSTGVAYMLKDINWDIHCCEVVSAFEFFPVFPGDIHFQIWRKKGSGKYELVATTMVSINSTQVGSVYNHTLALKQRFNVEVGDEIGWYCPGMNMLPYQNCTIDVQLCPFDIKGVNQSSLLNVGDLYDWDNEPSVTTIQGRGYALKFYTHLNTPPYTNQTLYDTLVKDHSPIGTRAIEYSIQDDDIGDSITSTFSHTLFELNETFPDDIHIQTKSLLPKNYNVYQCVLKSWDTCSNTATTTIQITTYNAPPYFLNLPEKTELLESVSTRTKLITLDVIDRSENDSICCTLAKVEPASLNFELVFQDNLYHLYTTSTPVFNYKEISNYYKLRVCCSDTYGTSMSFFEIDVVDVIAAKAYVPPTWFLRAVAISMVPISVTFLFACSMLCITMFCDADIRYIIIYE